MKTKVVRHGNSKAVVIPTAVAADLGWEAGKEVEVDQLAGGVSIHEIERRSWTRALKRVVRDHKTLIEELAKR